MSQDPKRLLDGTLTDDERRALRAGRGMEPPAGDKEAVLAAVLAKVGSVGSGGDPAGGLESGAGGSGAVGGTAGAGAAGKLAGATGSAIKTGISASAWIKAFGVGGGLTAAALMGHELTSSPPPEPAPMTIATAIVQQPAASVRSLVKPPQPAAPAKSIEPPAEARVVRPAIPAPVPEEVPDAATDVRWESAAVARARAQLRSGQPHEAMKTLGEIQKRVPNGILGQEREALAIEALAASGQTSAASARAAAFVQRYPSSPHASRVRAFVRP